MTEGLVFFIIRWRSISMRAGPAFLQFAYARTLQARSVLQDLGLNILLYEKQTRLINSKYGPGNQLINSLLTGYKTHVSCNKTSMSCDKKC